MTTIGLFSIDPSQPPGAILSDQAGKLPAISLISLREMRRLLKVPVWMSMILRWNKISIPSLIDRFLAQRQITALLLADKPLLIREIHLIALPNPIFSILSSKKSFLNNLNCYETASNQHIPAAFRSQRTILGAYRYF